MKYIYVVFLLTTCCFFDYANASDVKISGIEDVGIVGDSPFDVSVGGIKTGKIIENDFVYSLRDGKSKDVNIVMQDLRYLTPMYCILDERKLNKHPEIPSDKYNEIIRTNRIYEAPEGVLDKDKYYLDKFGFGDFIINNAFLKYKIEGVRVNVINNKVRSLIFRAYYPGSSFNSLKIAAIKKYGSPTREEESRILYYEGVISESSRKIESIQDDLIIHASNSSIRSSIATRYYRSKTVNKDPSIVEYVDKTIAGVGRVASMEFGDGVITYNILENIADYFRDSYNLSEQCMTEQLSRINNALKSESEKVSEVVL